MLAYAYKPFSECRASESLNKSLEFPPLLLQTVETSEDDWEVESVRCHRLLAF